MFWPFFSRSKMNVSSDEILISTSFLFFVHCLYTHQGTGIEKSVRGLIIQNCWSLFFLFELVIRMASVWNLKSFFLSCFSLLLIAFIKEILDFEPFIERLQTTEFKYINLFHNVFALFIFKFFCVIRTLINNWLALKTTGVRERQRMQDCCE